MVQNCCNKTLKNKGYCIRKKDNKTFKLPRRFRRSRCLKGIKGFSMKSFCKLKVVKKGLKKKRKKMKGGSKKLSAVCVLHNNKNNVSGTIKFSQKYGKKG